MSKTVGPDEENECSSCHIANVLLHVTPAPLFTKRTEDYLFCDFCFETFAGNAAQYPDQYPDGEVMQHICAVANILLRKIKESERRG